MAILLIAGSARAESSNRQLLRSIEQVFSDRDFVHFEGMGALPLFLPDTDRAPWPEAVLDWRATLRQADAIIISTPEYIHNMPALLKNALEWVASSGEFVGKPVLAVTFTPHAPRGDRARQSLLWSLGALDANVVAEVPFYQNEMAKKDGQLTLSGDAREMLREALQLLGG